MESFAVSNRSGLCLVVLFPQKVDRTCSEKPNFISTISFLSTSNLGSTINHKQSKSITNLHFHTIPHQNQDTTFKTTFNTRTFLGKSKKSPTPVLAQSNTKLAKLRNYCQVPSLAHTTARQHLSFDKEAKFGASKRYKNVKNCVFCYGVRTFREGGGDAFMWRRGTCWGGREVYKSIVTSASLRLSWLSSSLGLSSFLRDNWIRMIGNGKRIKRHSQRICKGRRKGKKRASMQKRQSHPGTYMIQSG